MNLTDNELQWILNNKKLPEDIKEKILLEGFFSLESRSELKEYGGKQISECTFSVRPGDVLALVLVKVFQYPALLAYYFSASSFS